MTATARQVRAGFAALRELCDPLGHPLLDELEHACLLAVTGCDTMADAIRRLQEREIMRGEISTVADLHADNDLVARIGAYRMTGQDAA